MKANMVIGLSWMLLWLSPIYPGLQAQPDARGILEAVDEVLNAPGDMQLSIRVVIHDRRGNENIRELSMMQKGSDHRMIKFLSPADQKGIGFLSLPGDHLTLYMPAYGKTRRIGGHVKNSKFAGTDYTYEDMEAKRYTERYAPRLLKSSTDQHVLELVPLAGFRSDYARLVMTIRKSDNYPVLVEYFDKANVLTKTLESKQIKRTGAYLLAHQTVMTDVKSGSSTRMEVVQVAYDKGLGDDLFTERYLIR